MSGKRKKSFVSEARPLIKGKLFEMAISDPRSRFILVGCVNTIFGYLIALGVYHILKDFSHIIAIGVIINVLCITLSFLTYKLLVFRSQGNWLHEYLKSYLVYGLAGILGVAALWLLVDGLSMPFWIAQALTILVVATLSYFFHLRFTFHTKAL